MIGARVFVLLMLYAAYRLLDILSYELEIVFLDRHQDTAKAGGHLLSVDRRIMLLFIHLLDFIGCYAILYLGIVSVQAEGAFTAPSSSPRSKPSTSVSWLLHLPDSAQ
jgi:hypothetical protein